jgi:hypothetical protein
MGLRVIRDGKVIEIPVEIESEGGEVLEAYEAAALAALNRAAGKAPKVTTDE